MRRVTRRVGMFVVAMTILGACASQSFAPIVATRPEPKTVISRTVRFTRAPAPSPSHPTAPSRSPVAANVSPWPLFNGHLTGAVNRVARVQSESIGVSVNAGEAPRTTLTNRSPLGAPRVLLVVEDAGEWLRVLLPIRPNSSAGWIRRADVEVTDVHYRIEVDRLAHSMKVFLDNNVITEQPVAVGKASTPTPVGQFFTVELLQPPNGRGAYGPYAFTLSAYSNVFQTFGSGDGAVGMHGTNEPASIGRAASHGCVRVANDVVTWLAGFLPLGTPVFIR